MPNSAAAVANDFLELGWSEKNPITQMKLQKLLYYAHAWYLANFAKPLFDEDFEAWPWGPVVRDIYYDTAEFGREPITRHVRKLTVAPSENSVLLDARFTAPRLEDAQAKQFVQQVWSTHKGFSGIQLSNSTHAPGEPWTIIKERYGTLANKPTIPNDLIAEVFKKKLANVRATATAAGHSAA